ncbi:MAG: 3-dehydroquinate synthase [Lentisphaerae bacterium]|nr:3-dehydroquinate synthase [Lentisphaerota bacterium]
MLSSDFSIAYHYDTIFTEGVFEAGNIALADVFRSLGSPSPIRVLVLFERQLLAFYPNLAEDIAAYCEHYSDLLLPASPPVPVDGGEAAKDMDVAMNLCHLLLQARMCRQSCLVIVGGGALLDAAGFAAAIFHRGIRQIRIPTTALAQADSGVGVKNAVNAFGKKNLLGVFAPPLAVLNDSRFLRTLPPQRIAEAAAEAVKVAMIKDADFFAFLQEKATAIMADDAAAQQAMVKRSAELHVQHIATSGDPFEWGSARPLDFGHWAAHKLEMLSDSRLSHGVAVGMGLLIDTKYAVLSGLIPETVFQALKDLLAGFQLPFCSAHLEQRDSQGRREVFAGIEEFREHLGGRLHITLPTAIGRKIEVTEINGDRMEQAIAAVIAECGEGQPNSNQA